MGASSRDVGGRITLPAQWRGERAGIAPALVVVAGVVAFHAVLSGRYGFHRDELYYLEAGRHPAAGYVDHPPFVPLLARALGALTGDGLWPLRVVAGAAHGTIVLVAGLLARDLGGGRRAVVLAGLATATAPLLMASGSLFQPAVFDQLAWAVVWLLVVRLLAGSNVRWWLAVGAVVGLGLETKATIVMLAAGLAAGLVVVPEARRHLRSPWLWAGAALALVLWLPNLAWQAANDWPTLQLTRQDRAEDGRLGFVVQQVGLAGPAALVLAAAGVRWLGQHRPWRALAVAVGTVAVALVVAGGEGSDLGPVYPLVFAAGGVAAERWIADAAEADPAESVRRWRWAVGGLALVGLVALPAVAPVAPVDVYRSAFHNIDEDLGEEVGWPEMVDQVAAVVQVLPADEQATARVVTASYGEAAAIALYGPARGLPSGTALSGHNSYADWWPDGEPAGTVVTVRLPRRVVERYCDVLGPVAVVSNPWDVPNEVAGAPILICRRLRVSPEDLRGALRRYG
jgi:Dolichyl-phosphate-mannose-protein mannosyltransferase